MNETTPLLTISKPAQNVEACEIRRKKQKMDTDLKNWEKRRQRTYIAFFMEAVCLGMEYSLTFITLWLYLDKEMKVQHPKFFYSIISAAYLLSQIMFSIIFGWITDKYRNVSFMFIVSNFLIITGNILYTIPLNPWLLFFGRLISGGGGSLRAIMTSEITRSYPFEELSSKFSAMGMAFALGFICGPAINFAFLKFHVTIFGIHINYANAPGMYLSIIFVIMLFIAFFLVSNLSKEFDLKESMSKEESTSLFAESTDETSNIGNEPNDHKEMISIGTVTKKIFTNLDTIILIIFSFCLMFCMVVYDLWQPLAVIQFSHWGVFEINLIIFGYGISTVLVLLLLAVFPVSDEFLGYLTWLCTICVGLISVFLILLKLASSYVVINIVCWLFYALCFAVIVVMEEIFLINTMAKMTDAKVQAIAESVRLACSRFGALVALLTAAILFDYIIYMGSVIILCSILGLLCLIWRRKSFSNPKIIIK